MAPAEQDTFRIVPDRLQDRSGRFQCHIWICPQPEGGYTVFCPLLPGAVSEGESVEEAISNIRQAMEALLAEYLENQQGIPWLAAPAEDKPARAIEKWIVVNVA